MHRFWFIIVSLNIVRAIRMKVVVTGGSGKVGRWVVRELLDVTKGRPPHEVTVFDQFTRQGEQDVNYLKGDIEDYGQVLEAVVGAGAVIHLAAIGKLGVATEDVTFRTNVLGTYNVHQAAYRLGIKRVVSASSQAVLGWNYRERDFEPEYLPIDEDHPVKPQDAYGLSKEVVEVIARSYARKGLETIVLRPNFVVTPEELEQLRLQGGRQPTRFLLYSYIDARDLAAAFRLAIEQPSSGNKVLFVVADDSCVAEPLCEVLPRLMPAIGDKARNLTGTKAAISNALAKEFLGWQPLHTWRSP